MAYKNRFSPNEIEFTQIYHKYQGSIVLIAKHYNISCDTARRYAKRLGVWSKASLKVSEAQIRDIENAYYTSTSSELARQYNISPSRVKQIWRKCGLKGKPPYTYYSNFNYFEQLNSKDKAYLLGFIASDGTIYSRPHHQKQLSIKVHSKDEKVLRLFKKYTDSHNPITQYEKKSAKGVKSVISEFTIVSDKLCNDLSKFNITTRKTWTFTPINIPKQLMNHFIRGYFDGDGCLSLYKDGRLVPSFVGNRSTMTFLQNEFNYNNINSSLREDEREYTEPFYELKIKANSVQQFISYIYAGCDELYLDRKREVYYKYLALINNKN